MIARRLWLAAALAWPASHGFAQQRRSLADPLRVGVDTALFDSGLARALRQGFGRDTGVAIQLIRMPAIPLLEGLDRGEFDVALTNTPEAETRLEAAGLAHDRQPIASGNFALVGPAPRGKQKDPAAIAGLTSAVEALIQIRSAALAMPGAITFLSAGDGSGTHVMEQTLWRSAKLGPTAPWYDSADAGSSLIAQARARGAYALVERGAWAVQGGAPLALLVTGDPALDEAVHVMRAFRIKHPAGKLFVGWIAGRKGRRVVAAQAAYRPM